MSLPEESVAVNTLPEVTTIPTGKKLIFTDPDTNEGGIITLENLTKQILQNLTTQTFGLDQGNLTLLQAINQLNSKTKLESIGTIKGNTNLEEFKATTGEKAPGIYKIQGAVIEGISNEVFYGTLILLPVYNTQILIVGGGITYARDYTGSPTTWATWKKYSYTTIK